MSVSSAYAAPGNPFQPRALPPVPPAPSLGWGDSFASALGFGKAVAKSKFAEACRAFNAGNFARADALFVQVQAKDLSDPAAVQARINFYRAFCAAHSRNYQSALQLIEFVCQQQPGNPAAFALAGRVRYVLGHYAEAVNAFQRAGNAKEIQAALDVAAREYAAQLAHAGQLDAAWNWIESLRPRAPGLATWLGQICYARAGEHYLARRYADATGECDRATQFGAPAPPIKYLRGAAHLARLNQTIAQLDLAQARIHAQGARANLPAHYAARLDQLAQGIEQIAFQTGALRLLAKDNAAAIQILKRVTTAPLAPLKTWVLLALALYWNNETERAWQTLASAPTTTQELPEAKYLAGYLARRLNKNDEAYTALRQLYSEHPDFPGAQKELAGASYVCGVAQLATEPVLAVEMIRFAREVNPSPPMERALARALFAAGARVLAAKDYANAHKYLADAAMMTDAPAATRVYLGLAHLGQAAAAMHAGNLAEAIRQTETCLDVWLGAGWNIPSSNDRAEKIKARITDDLRAEWIDRTLAFYAALLLQQAAADPSNAQPSIQRARECLSATTALTPATAPTRFLRGLLAYFLDRDLKIAAAELGAANDGGLSAPEMLRILAAACFGSENFARALPAYRALVNDPAWSSPLLAFYAAYCLWKTGALSAAAEMLEKFARSAHAPSPVVFFYGYLLYLAGDAPRAWTVLCQLRDQPGEAAPVARALPAVTFAAGVAHAHAGNLDEAHARLTEANKFAPVEQPTRKALAAVEHLRAIQALRENRFAAAHASAEKSIQFNPTRQTALGATVGVAHFGQAITQLNQANRRAARESLERAESTLAQAQLVTDAPWSAYIALARAVASLDHADNLNRVGELLEQSYRDVPGFAPAAVLCGAYRWHVKHDSAGALAAWQTGLPNARRAPVAWRLIGMAHLANQKYAEASQAYASYRFLAGDAGASILDYQVFCLLMEDRADDALKLLPTGTRAHAPRLFLRGYAQFKLGKWHAAYTDLAQIDLPRAHTFAALALCRIAQQWIDARDLTRADQTLTTAAQLGGAEVRPAIEQAQAYLRWQRGMDLLRQRKWKLALEQLSSAWKQGVSTNGMNNALGVARFFAARSDGLIEEMYTQVENLRPSLPERPVVGLLIELAAHQLRVAMERARQLRAASPAHTRAELIQLLNQAARFMREALRIDQANYQVHYWLGSLAYRLLDDPRQALAHLQRAETLRPRTVPEGVIDSLYVDAGQIFQAKRVFFTRWRKNPDDDRTRQELKSILQKEAALCRRFARGETPEESKVAAENLDVAQRAQLLSIIVDQLETRARADQRDAISRLRIKLKQARLDQDSAQLNEAEKTLFNLFGASLLE